MQAINYMVKLLGSKMNVVHSYAANAIEKLLIVKAANGTNMYVWTEFSDLFG